MDVIGDYEYNKKDLIGHGAFAVVFKGRRRDDTNKIVAIKSITKKNLAKSQNLLSKEIKILKELSSLHHENVVQLMDCKETSHHVYLVMEYCNGGDLADYLHSKGTLSEDTIVVFLRQIAGAMLALNAKGVVHRDLKPQNLLLCHSGKSANPPPREISVKIADFGFARFLSDGVMAATLCGSPMYMAPEVIMSLQYDAKADLWSIGTIVFQCLTGKAPFQAQTPQQLKQFYEKHLDLKPSIPSGTSPELKDLLCALLKRNAKDRIDFEAFHAHPFLNPAAREKKTAPVPVPARRRASCSSASDSPSVKTVTASPLSGYMPSTPPDRRVGDGSSRPDNAENAQAAQYGKEAHSPGEDFVMVPEHLPGDFSDNEFYPRPASRASSSRASSCSDRSDVRSHEPMSTRQSGYDTSPGRPSSLLVPSPNVSPQSEPIPVPTQVQAYQQLQRNSPSSPYCRTEPSSLYCRTEPRNMSRQGSDMSLHRSDEVAIQRKSSYGSAADIGSLSPPSVQFVIGTPPSAPAPWRRSSISGGTPPLNRHPPPVVHSPHRLCDEPDAGFLPPRTKQRSMTEPTELHRFGSGGTSPGLDRDQLLRVAFGGPGTSPPSYYNRSPYSFTSRQKERARRRSSPGQSPGLDNYARSPPAFDHAAMFIPPELAEETLMDREHNETMSKLNFVLALVECIMELAQNRNTPLTESMNQASKLDTFTLDRLSFISEGQRRVEQLVLYVRSLQMLSSSLHLAKAEIAAGRLQPSSTLKTALKSMNTHYHYCLKVCKNLQTKGQVPNLNLAQNSGITAEKLIYSYAIEMCQTAALDELFGNPGECFRRYQQAQILLHSLSQQASNSTDKHLLDKYKNSVIKRLYNLQNQGFIYSVESSN